MKPSAGVAIGVAVVLAALADSVSALWARGDRSAPMYLLLLCLLGPLVFISFGLVTRHVGLSIASAVVNSLIVLASMSIGLVYFGEWNKLSTTQYVGMVCAFTGIILMLFFPK